MVFLLVLVQGCQKEAHLPTLSHILYSVDSGPVLPELQMHEEYTITREGVKLVRIGRYTETQVYEGEWMFTVDESLLTDLFAITESEVCTAYRRIEPREPLDGGETATIELIYSDGSECSLIYDPGTIYEGAEALLQQIRKVLESLKVSPVVDVQ
jgi:hypothetical protein